MTPLSTPSDKLLLQDPSWHIPVRIKYPKMSQDKQSEAFDCNVGKRSLARPLRCESPIMALPMDNCALGNITADVFRCNEMNGDEYVRCSRCGYGGCDVRVSGCGCTLHAVSFVLFALLSSLETLQIVYCTSRDLYRCYSAHCRGEMIC